MEPRLATGVGAVAHADVMRSIEWFGTPVAPAVKDEVNRRARPRPRPPR